MSFTILKTVSVTKALNGLVYVTYTDEAGVEHTRAGVWYPTPDGLGEYMKFVPVLDAAGIPTPQNRDYPDPRVGGRGYRINYMD